MRGIVIIAALAVLSTALANRQQDRTVTRTDFERCPRQQGRECGGEGIGECVYREWTTTNSWTNSQGREVTVITNYKHGFCVCEPGSGRIGVNQPCVLPTARNLLRQAVATAILQGRTECDENDGNRAYCPNEDWVDIAQRGICVKHLRDCLGGNSTLIQRWRNRGSNANCSEGERFCGFEQSCVVNQADCSLAQSRCNSSEPVRCRGGACAMSRDACPAHNVTCPGNQVLCADGLTCLANHFQCAKRFTYNGCEADLMECPQDSRVCGQNASHCVELTGCPEDKKKCGRQVNASTGDLIFGDDGVPLPRCRDSCPRRRFLTKLQKRLNFRGSNQDRTVTWTDSEGNALLTMRIEDGVAVGIPGSGNSSVSFVIGPISDSALRWGAFRSLWVRSLLYGDPVAVNPESEIQITNPDNSTGNITLCMPLYANSEINTQALCENFVSNLQLFSVEDHNLAESNLSFVGSCRAEYSNGTCHCCSSATHFSTFAVSTSEEAADSAQSEDDGSDSIATTSSNSDGATEAIQQTTAPPDVPGPGNSPPPNPDLSDPPTSTDAGSPAPFFKPSFALVATATLGLLGAWGLRG